MSSERVSSSARSAVFAPLDPLGRAETVARRLSDAITLGLLTDSEQLPSETELANQFGVSTVTVREALMALRQRGLVETRRGRGGGSFVRTPGDVAPEGLRERLRQVTLSELRDIGDHYAAIAGTAARLAADRASSEDVARLEFATDEIRESAVSAHRAERRFHLEVAAVAQSPRLTQQEVRLQSEVGTLLWLPASEPGSRHRVKAEHEEITIAIRTGDGDRARRLTEDHVLDAVERLVELHLQMVEP